MGVYFKIKRGSTRLVGENRYALYSGLAGLNNITLIDETFNYRSTFFRNSHDGLYQQKLLSIKLKQETNTGGKD
jgi:hypothetical protein